MTQDEFMAGLKRDGYDEITTKDLPPAPANGDHGHHFDVRGLVVAGEFIVTIGGVAKSHRVGDIFEVANDTVHTETIGADGASVIIGRRYG